MLVNPYSDEEGEYDDEVEKDPAIDPVE